MNHTVVADKSYGEQCQDGDDPARHVGLLPADNDTLFREPEAIVVGAIGTGAPWFLTGWAEGTDIEFMIDNGCQVTVLVMLVF